MDHKIYIEDDFKIENCEYFKFLDKISGGDNAKLVYCLSLIGYLLHKYKDPARPFAVILAEETENEAKGGGTGKGIFVKALGYINNLVVVDGKNFKIDKNFAFQRVDLDTRLIAIEDTRKNVDFEGFYSIITEGTFEAPTNTKFVGTLNNAMKIYVNTYAGNDTVLVGYKGANESDAAAFYCPYIPLMSSGVVLDPSTFEPVVSFMTRYGYIELTNTASSFGNAADYVGEIAVQNLTFQ